jgi:UPF0271 protein
LPYTTLDLNADLGETEGDYLGLLPLITSANVACGAHAGGGSLLTETVKAALEQGVQVGAHPSYPDRENFGRLSMRGQVTNLVEVIAEQVKLVIAELQKHGARLSHVKAHGALYNDAMVHEDIAQAVIDAIKEVAPDTKVLGLPNSVLERLCKEQGLNFIAEGFLDRAYSPDGTLVPRTQAGAVLDHDEALKQIEYLLATGTVIGSNGVSIPLEIQTLCVHADTPDAAQTAGDVKNLLIASGIKVEAF